MYIAITWYGERLDPTNPQSIDVAEETLSIRHPEFSSREITTYVSILTSCRSTRVYTLASVQQERSPTTLNQGTRTASQNLKRSNLTDQVPWSRISEFGRQFELRIILGACLPTLRIGGIIQVSCYALFKGWLLLSQPPCCVGKQTTFPT